MSPEYEYIDHLLEMAHLTTQFNYKTKDLRVMNYYITVRTYRYLHGSKVTFFKKSTVQLY